VNRPSYFADGKGSAWLDGLEKRTGQTLLFPKNANGPLQQALAGQPFGYPYKFSNQNGVAMPNWRDIGPRLGIAFRPFGDTKTVIRGGFGIYYDIYNGTNNANGQRPFFVVGFTPSRPSFEPPPFTLGQVPTLTPGFAPGEPLYVGYNAWPQWPDARSDQWNITVQRQLGGDTALEIAYVGNRHLHGVSAYGWNHIYMPGYTFNYDDGTSFTIQPDTPLTDRVKYPELASRATTRAIDHGTYHALQVYLTRQMSHGIQFRAGYTRCRSHGFELEGYGPLNVEVPDEWNTNINFPLQNDVTNVFFATWIWQLPGFNLHGLPGAVIGGWQVAGILTKRSGLPVDVNEAICQWDGASICKPILLHDPNLPSSQRTLQRWFDTSAFQTPGPNEFGSNAAIDSVRGPGPTNLDLTLSKYFKIHERHRIQFRAEFFNALNHPSFGLPATTNDSGGFGQITSSGRGREIQLALKYEF